MSTADEHGEPAVAPDQDAAQQTRRLRRGIISLAVLIVLVVALVLAVPGLRAVQTLLRNADEGWIVAALALEVVSCLGYVAIFQLVFDRAPRGFAARLAWSEMAFGAALSLGGAGSLALGAWVLHSIGVPAARVAERSAVLFLVTSAVNAFTLTLFAFALSVGILDGPSSPLLTIVPAAVGATVIAFFLMLPRFADRAAARLAARPRVAALLRGTADSVRGTVRVLLSGGWRLLGAVGYLLCDIAVLWACLRALGVDAPIAPLVLAYQIGYLTNLIPIPGGVGALDGGLIGMLVLYGVRVAPATAGVLAYHAIALWVPTVFGTFAYALLRRQLREPIVPREVNPR